MIRDKRDLLQELILALSVQEKRYIHLFLSSFTKNSELQLELFSVYNKYEDIDKLSNALSKVKSKGLKSNFNFYKHSLYVNILKGLHLFNYEDEFDAENKLIHAEILFNKGLYNQSQKILKKVLKLAKDNHQFSIYIKANDLYKKVLCEKFDVKALSVYLESQLVAEEEALKQEAEFVKLQSLKAKFLLQSRLDKFDFKNRISELIESNHDLLNKIPNSSCSESIQLYIDAMIDVSKGDFRKASVNFYKVMQLSIANRASKKATIEKVSSIYNWGITALYLKRYKELETAIELLTEISKQKNSDIVKIKLFNYNSLILSYNCYKGDFQENINLSNSIFKQLENYKKAVHITSKTYILFYIMLSYFAQAEYKKARRLVSKIINNKAVDAVPNVQRLTEFLNILISLETDDTEYAEKLSRRFLNVFEAEKVEYKLISFIYDKLQKNFTISKNDYGEMFVLFGNVDSKEIPDEFNFSAWLKSKKKETNYLKEVQNSVKIDLLK